MKSRKQGVEIFININVLVTISSFLLMTGMMNDTVKDFFEVAEVPKIDDRLLYLVPWLTSCDWTYSSLQAEIP